MTRRNLWVLFLFCGSPAPPKIRPCTPQITCRHLPVSVEHDLLEPKTVHQPCDLHGTALRPSLWLQRTVLPSSGLLQIYRRFGAVSVNLYRNTQRCVPECSVLNNLYYAYLYCSCREISRLVCNQKFHCHDHKTPLLVTILSQMNPDHNNTPSFFSIHNSPVCTPHTLYRSHCLCKSETS